jgi:DNA-binding CsgD family transcriptional regulator
MNIQLLPAGLKNDDGEIFAEAFGQPEQLTGGKILPFEEFNRALYNQLEVSMLMQPNKHAKIKVMVGEQGRFAEVKQFTYCTHGGFDNIPDVINGVLKEPEFWHCPKRGNCQFEGVVCNSLACKNGVLTKRELEYLTLTAKGYLDKEIAGIMMIKYSTVTTFNKNVRSKTGLFRKVDLTRFAIQNNLL